MIRDTPATAEGVVERDGVKVRYQVFGAGEQTILLLPTWSIVHSDFWRHQVPHLAQNNRVVTFDGRGNGASDRPTTAESYSVEHFAADATAVLDAVGVERTVVASVSAGAGWQLLLAAQHPERVSGAIFIGASLPLGEMLPDRLPSLVAFDEPRSSYDGWWKFNRHYWRRDWEGFLEFFFGRCFTEPDSTEEIAHFVSMGRETDADTLLLTVEAPALTHDRVRRLAGDIRCPVLVIHGDDDAISSVTRGRELAALTGGELVVMPGVGHEPQSRWPVELNATIDAFLRTVAGGTRRA